MATAGTPSTALSWTSWALAVVAVAALGFSGCAFNDAGSQTSSPASSPTSSPDQPDERHAVEAAYRVAIETYETGLANPAASSNQLESWWAEPALSAARSQINSWAGRRQALSFPEPSQRSLQVLSVSFAGDTATVTACFVDDGQVIDAVTGTILDDDVATVIESAILRRFSGTWRLAERAQLERREGAQPCGGE